MSRKGENIYKRKDGRWEGRYIKAYSFDGKAKYGYCYGQSYREVKEKLAKQKASLLIKYGSEIKTTRRRFGTCCDEWLMLKRLEVKESTYSQYYGCINRYIKPKLGNCYISALTSSVIEGFSRELLLKEGLSPKTVKDILVLLKNISDYTRKKNPGNMPAVEIVYPKAQKKEMRVLSCQEQRLLTEYLLTDMDSVKFGVILTLMTGLRIGEVCALRWSDISLEEKVIRVSTTMQRVSNFDENGGPKTKVIITGPKSRSSYRVIPLNDYMINLCRIMERKNDSAYVLSGSSEYFIEPRSLQYKLEQYAKACGLEGVHYHTLRHSFATRCVEADFEIKSLSEILGHSSSKITLDYYIHSSIELKRQNINKLNQIGNGYLFPSENAVGNH